MEERRSRLRLLCAELVEVSWTDQTGRERKGIANLEDISVSGVCLQFDHPIPRGSSVAVRCGKGELLGTVRYSFCRDEGHFIGVQFKPGSRWSQKNFKPSHLLDPSDVAGDPGEGLSIAGTSGLLLIDRKISLR
jgi:hypothetical protein